MREKILEAYPDETFLFADGFDNAIIGVDEQTMRIIYSVDSCIILLSQHMTIDEAIEYFNFNVEGSYVGPQTPIWCRDICTCDLNG